MCRFKKIPHVRILAARKVSGGRKAAGKQKKKRRALPRPGTRRAIRLRLADALGGKCYVCGQKFGRRFQFHHARYRDGKSYRDFATPKQYVVHLAGQIEQWPEDFYLLCHRHHYTVEHLKMWDAAKFRRMMRVVETSEGRGYTRRLTAVRGEPALG